MVESERQEIQLRLAVEQLRGLVDFARDVLKLVTLINGGAAIALLAFAGVVRSLPIRFTPTPTRARMGANRI